MPKPRGDVEISSSLRGFVYVDANNVKVFSVANEMQQWVSFAMLSRCKIFRNAVNNVTNQNSIKERN